MGGFGTSAQSSGQGQTGLHQGIKEAQLDFLYYLILQQSHRGLWGETVPRAPAVPLGPALGEAWRVYLWEP